MQCQCQFALELQGEEVSCSVNTAEHGLLHNF